MPNIYRVDVNEPRCKTRNWRIQDETQVWSITQSEGRSFYPHLWKLAKIPERCICRISIKKILYYSVSTAPSRPSVKGSRKSSTRFQLENLIFQRCLDSNLPHPFLNLQRSSTVFHACAPCYCRLSRSSRDPGKRSKLSSPVLNRRAFHCQSSRNKSRVEWSKYVTVVGRVSRGKQKAVCIWCLDSSNVGFFRVVLHAGHCTDDLASVDFIIYVARSPKWLYERCPRGTNRGKRRLRIVKQGHLRALHQMTSFHVTNLPRGCELFSPVYVYTCIYICTIFCFSLYLCISSSSIHFFVFLSFFLCIKHLSMIERLMKDWLTIETRSSLRFRYQLSSLFSSLQRFSFLGWLLYLPRRYYSIFLFFTVSYVLLLCTFSSFVHNSSTSLIPQIKRNCQLRRF